MSDAARELQDEDESVRITVNALEDMRNGRVVQPTTPDDPPTASKQQDVVPRSRWQAVLLEAGGLSAALSEESMRRLQYCLHWLRYATTHIDAQILILRDFIASLHPFPSSASDSRPASITHAHLRTLSTVRRDIVQTIRQVVDVVSRYAGGALPEPARTHVRGFVLGLPQRWARKAGTTPHDEGPRQRDKEKDLERESVAAAAGCTRRGRRACQRERGAGVGSTPSSRAPSPNGRHAHAHARQHHNQEDGKDERETVPASTAIVAAQRILTLATESLDMMRGVTGVVKDSLDRADAWVGRLRTVGIHRTGTQRNEEVPPLPPSPRVMMPHNRSMSGDSEVDLSYAEQRRNSEAHSLVDELDEQQSPYSGTSSAYSSYAGGSVPTTPAGSYTQGFPCSCSCGYVENVSSPGLGLGSMSLTDSRYSTPRSIAKAFPDDGTHELGITSVTTKERGVQEVKIVGTDVETEVENNPSDVPKMEIDS